MASDAVTVTLGGMAKRAQAYVDSGRFPSLEAVLNAGLAALDREEDRINAILRAKLAEADADPRPSVPLAEAMERVRASLRAR